MSGRDHENGDGTPDEREIALTEADYAALFDLAPEHTLSLVREGRTRRGRTRHVTRWLDERDALARLVARYRTWTNRSAEPPYRTQFGWERYSPGGRLLDREVRYSTRASVRALN